MFASNMVNVVEKDGELFVTSVEIAHRFGITHFNILRAIKNIIKNLPNDFHELNFECVNIVDKNQIGGRVESKYYILSRDAFSLIAMGLTGKKALHWKVVFLTAFNEMERVIKQQIPMLQAQLADLNARLEQRRQLALPGTRKNTMPAPIYRETLFGTVELVGFEIKAKSEMSEEENIEAKQMHNAKTINGINKTSAALTEKAGAIRRQKQAKIIEELKK